LVTKSLGIAIHFTVELSMVVQGVPVGGVILVSFNVEQGPVDGALVHQNAGGFLKIIVVFVRVGEPVAFSAAEKRATAVTAKLDMDRRKLEMGAQLVDHIHEGIQTGVFTLGGTLVVS
jgi:hypothetical protein